MLYFLEAKDSVGGLVGSHLVVIIAVACAGVTVLATFLGEMEWGATLARTVSWIRGKRGSERRASASDNQVALMNPVMEPGRK